MTTHPEHPTFKPALVLPTYNNAGTLADVVERSLKLGFTTYVVDDGSSDETSRVLQQFASDPRLRCLAHDVNQGKAAAMRTGFAAAAGDRHTHAATIDTDGQLDPEDALRLLEQARRHPKALVLGSRRAKIDRYPVSNRLGRSLANWFIWLECGLRVIDSQCGLRVYPLAMLERVPVRAGRFGFETEVITRAGWAGTPVLQVPVNCRYFENGERVTHFRPWMDTMRAIGLHAFLLGRRLIPVRHSRWSEEVQRAGGDEARAQLSDDQLPFQGEPDPAVARVAK